MPVLLRHDLQRHEPADGGSLWNRTLYAYDAADRLVEVCAGGARREEGAQGRILLLVMISKPTAWRSRGELVELTGTFSVRDGVATEALTR